MSGPDSLNPSGDGGARSRHLAGLLLFAARYFLSGPDERLHGILGDEEWWRSLHEAGVVGPRPEGPGGDLDAHRGQYNELLRVPGSRFVPPFEQAYHEGKATVDASAPGECARVYREAGYQTAPYAGVQADHIGHQLRFVAALLEREAECADRGEETAVERVRTWQEGFLADRCWWWPRFAADVRSRAPQREVAAAADLVAGLYETLRDRPASQEPVR